MAWMLLAAPTRFRKWTAANTYTTTLKFDLADNLTNIVNANAENIYYAFNDVGGLVAMADPYLGQWTYQRDYAGRLRVQTDARGDVSPIHYVKLIRPAGPVGPGASADIYSLNYSNHDARSGFHQHLRL